MATLRDDTDQAVPWPDEVSRVVSLVPSLTESVAQTGRHLLVGVTDWCTHPQDLDVRRVGGTKNPRVEEVAALAPDVVLANAEENRPGDLDALRAAGLAVHVTDIRTVDAALVSLRRVLRACGLGEPQWLQAAERAWAGAGTVWPDGGRRLAVVPIWRRPWMAVGRDTFTGDVLARLGVDNVLADDAERYPRVRLDDLPPHDLVVLPDEPYLFTEQDGPEAFPGRPCALVSGRLLTWYGPSMADAVADLGRSLGAARVLS